MTEGRATFPIEPWSLTEVGLDHTSLGVHESVFALANGHIGLRGKPQPDTFLAGARLLGADPAEAVVFEDALSGVAAGRAGNFGYVVGVDRVGQAEGLAAQGADVVVQDLSELLGGGS